MGSVNNSNLSARDNSTRTCAGKERKQKERKATRKPPRDPSPPVLTCQNTIRLPLSSAGAPLTRGALKTPAPMTDLLVQKLPGCITDKQQQDGRGREVECRLQARVPLEVEPQVQYRLWHMLSCAASRQNGLIVR